MTRRAVSTTENTTDIKNTLDWCDLGDGQWQYPNSAGATATSVTLVPAVAMMKYQGTTAAAWETVRQMALHVFWLVVVCVLVSPAVAFTPAYPDGAQCVTYIRRSLSTTDAAPVSCSAHG